ncbi:MAG: hypothetical protein HS111_33155 [Kofleriaceae bacterium]|nr:hypothetical protein [Kofleriaceae bacterium]
MPWFESLLSTVSGAERLAVVDQRARAHLAAHQPDRAIAAIESVLDDREPALELRTLLAQLYRDGEQWEPWRATSHPLARLLRRDDRGPAPAREAAAIYTGKLDAPAVAIRGPGEGARPRPGRQGAARDQLAVGLRIAGRLDEARTILGELIEPSAAAARPSAPSSTSSWPRRAHAEGKNDEALAGDGGGVQDGRQRTPASSASWPSCAAPPARTTSAERACLRARPAGGPPPAAGRRRGRARARSEVLFELSRLAAGHGDDTQARELLESAIDAAVQSDVEVRRMRRSLIAHGQAETLLRVLELRLAAAPEAASQARLYADMAEVLDARSVAPATRWPRSSRPSTRPRPASIPRPAGGRAMSARAGATRLGVDAVGPWSSGCGAVTIRGAGGGDPAQPPARRWRTTPAICRARAGAVPPGRDAGRRLAEAALRPGPIAAARVGDDEQQARALDSAARSSTAATAARHRRPRSTRSTVWRRSSSPPRARRARAPGRRADRAPGAAEPRWAQAEARPARRLDHRSRRRPGDGAARERVARNDRRQRAPARLPRQARAAPAAPRRRRCGRRRSRARARSRGAGEALLERAVTAARESLADGLGGAVWALLALIGRRAASGDLAAPLASWSARSSAWPSRPRSDPR